MPRTITLVMTEEVVTTIEIDRRWLADHGLPETVDALQELLSDDEQKVFEAIDATEDDTKTVGIQERTIEIDD